jgi:hypothetical protein
MQSPNKERLLEMIRQASAESIQTITCPNCNGGLTIQFSRNKRMVLAVACEACPWRVIADGIPEEPPWVGQLGPKVHTRSPNIKLAEPDGEKVALHSSRRKTK